VQQLCGIENGKHKVIYKTRAAAEKKRRQSGQESLFIYLCTFGDRNHYHLTHEAPRHKGERAPSAKTLRNHLEALGRNIRAQQRRLEASENRLRAEQEKARQREAEAQAAHDEEVRAINVLVNRLHRV
jgi:hypothetical protein